MDTHIAGVQRLARIALTSKRPSPPRFIFISSIASVGNYHSNFVPEQTFDDPALPLGQGYGQSKHVAERLLNQISAKAGLPVTIVRVGQLSGSASTGHWNRNEYMSLLLQSSVAIGKFPDWLPVRLFFPLVADGSLTSFCAIQDVRWMPTDVAAEVLLDIMLTKSNSCSPDLGADVYHLESPAITRGTDLVQWAVELSEGALVTVPLAQWLEAISTSPSKSASVKTAERLYDFFKTWLDKDASSKKASLSVEKTMKVSTAAACEGVSRELFAKYYGYAARSL